MILKLNSYCESSINLSTILISGCGFGISNSHGTIIIFPDLYFRYSCGKGRKLKLDENKYISNISLLCTWDRKWIWSLDMNQLPQCEWTECLAPPHPPNEYETQKFDTLIVR